MAQTQKPNAKTIHAVLRALASRGGKARAEKLSKRRRRAIARLGSRAAKAQRERERRTRKRSS